MKNIPEGLTHTHLEPLSPIINVMCSPLPPCAINGAVARYFIVEIYVKKESELRTKTKKN